MGQNSSIEWCHHTFNPWRGCTKVSPGCAHCYADALSKRNPRTLGVWGPNGSRVVAAKSAWREPLKWDRLAKEAGERHRVFCASLADVFEGEDTMPAEAWAGVEESRKRLFDLICRTPNLDWLLLTKRPQNALDTMVRAGLYAVANPTLPCPQPNLWIGTSVENQAAADERIIHLLRCPAAVRFLSCEPLLGPIDLMRCRLHNGGRLHALGGTVVFEPHDGSCGPSVDWVIVGGESGPGARPMHPAWARGIRDQCAAAGVPYFFKQWGEWRAVDVVKDDELQVISEKTTSNGPRMPETQNWPDGAVSLRVGKHAAGRLLDGRTHDAMPCAPEAAHAR